MVRSPKPPPAINWRSDIRFIVLLGLVIAIGNGASAIVHLFTRRRRAPRQLRDDA